MQPKDYKERTYLSAIEASKYLSISVNTLHGLVDSGIITAQIATSGQKRFNLKDLIQYEKKAEKRIKRKITSVKKISSFNLNGTTQRIFCKSSSDMSELPDSSVHLVITSPPYFNTKMYSRKPIEKDLGDVHDMNEWFEKIGEVWTEVYRVLQPGRKMFINIMNLPVRTEKGSFRTLNLVGKTIDLCEQIGFIFKRDIVWQKTNGVRAHFGTYPYPGGILLNNMHEFILEFEKPNKKSAEKYAHLSKEQKEQSKLDKDFWLLLKNSDVWLIKPQGSGDNRSHIAPFPYELPYRLIKAYSFVGENILDPFAGSATTLFASADLKRNGAGYEINPEIVSDATTQLKNYQIKILQK